MKGTVKEKWKGVKAERDYKGKMKGTVKEKWKGVKAERDCKGKMKKECKGKMKGTVKEKWKGVKAETWESQELIDTFKSSIWCSCLEKL